MKKKLLLLATITVATLSFAQPPADTSSKYPQGATYKHTSSTATINGSYSCSTQYYNVIQCTGGTLTMNSCTITKTGDGSNGDNSSFYGNNSSIYCGSASSSGYSSTTSASGAKIIITGGTVTSESQGANAVFATNGATIEVDGITIVNNKSVSRGLHATYGGIINASNVDITTNEATSSTIATDRGGGTVTVNSGAVWNLTADTSIGTLVNNGIINTNGYTLTYTSKSGSGTINNSSTAVIIGTTGWATLYSPVALDFSSVSGLTAYTASFGTSTVTLTAVEQVPANTAVVLNGTASTTYTIPTASSAAAVSNDLKGTLTGVAAGTSYYALGEVDSKVGFRLLTEGIGIPGGKGYYAASSSARSFYTLTTPTGIVSAGSQQSSPGTAYDLQGRRANESAKGIVIRDGKKYVK